jgi:hypothetical protein
VKSRKSYIRLFQSIRHQGSEQVSKPDIHHVDFYFDLRAVKRKKRSRELTIEVGGVVDIVNIVSGGHGHMAVRVYR